MCIHVFTPLSLFDRLFGSRNFVYTFIKITIMNFSTTTLRINGYNRNFGKTIYIISKCLDF